MTSISCNYQLPEVYAFSNTFSPSPLENSRPIKEEKAEYTIVSKNIEDWLIENKENIDPYWKLNSKMNANSPRGCVVSSENKMKRKVKGRRSLKKGENRMPLSDVTHLYVSKEDNSHFNNQSVSKAQIKSMPISKIR